MIYDFKNLPLFLFNYNKICGQHELYCLHAAFVSSDLVTLRLLTYHMLGSIVWNDVREFMQFFVLRIK